jgi:hypothetical protein
MILLPLLPVFSLQYTIRERGAVIAWPKGGKIYTSWERILYFIFSPILALQFKYYLGLGENMKCFLLSAFIPKLPTIYETMLLFSHSCHFSFLFLCLFYNFFCRHLHCFYHIFPP